MSLSPNEKYPGATEADPNYKDSKFKDNNPSTTNNGSPLKALDRNEQLALQEAMMNAAGFDYNGVVDTPQNSQMFAAYKAALSNGANLLSNHNFIIASPDDSQPAPSATPTSYPPGYQIFSGVFANEATGILNLTYIDGRVSFSGGDFYMPVQNTGALENITEFVASVADFDGKPRTRGVSFALVGDEYRVTVGVDALEDAGAVLTPLGSVKFEQGSVATGHRVETYFNNKISPVELGASSSKDDNSDSFNNCADICRERGLIMEWAGDFKIQSDINLRGVSVDAESGSITCGSGSKVILGNKSNVGFGPYQRIYTVLEQNNNESLVVVRVVGSKGQEISIGYTTYFQVYADTQTNEAEDGSSAYSTYNLNYATKIEITNNKTTTGSLKQWINENTFNVKRCRDVVIDGTYAHNHNKFVGGTFENDSTIFIDSGYSNKFYDVRFEQNPGSPDRPSVTFNEDTWDNEVIATWDSSVANIGVVNVDVTDNGQGNSVHSDIDRVMDRVFSKTLSSSDIVINPSSNSRSANMLTVSGGANEFYSSGLIPCRKGSSIRFSAISNTNGDMKYRYYIKLYGLNRNFIFPNNDQITSDVLSANGNDGFTMGTGSDRAYAQIINSGVYWCEVGITGSFTQDTTIEQQASSVTASVYIPKSNTVYDYKNSIEFRDDPAFVTGAPSEGFAPLGYQVSSASGTYTCTFSRQQSLSVQSTSGDTSLQTNSSGVIAGDLIGVNTDTLDTEWFEVTSASGNVINIDGSLAGNSPIGSQVFISRFSL